MVERLCEYHTLTSGRHYLSRPPSPVIRTSWARPSRRCPSPSTLRRPRPSRGCSAACQSSSWRTCASTCCSHAASAPDTLRRAAQTPSHPSSTSSWQVFIFYLHFTLTFHSLRLRGGLRSRILSHIAIHDPIPVENRFTTAIHCHSPVIRKVSKIRIWGVPPSCLGG